MADSTKRRLTPEQARAKLRQAAADLEQAGDLSRNVWRNIGLAAAAGVLLGMSRDARQVITIALRSLFRK